MSDLAPSFNPFSGCGCQMRIRSLRDYGQDFANTQLSGLFDRPLQAIKLEDGQDQPDIGFLGSGCFFTKFELDAIILNRSDSSQSDAMVTSDIELLPNTRAQNPGKMACILSDERSTISGYLVGNPATSSHRF